MDKKIRLETLPTFFTVDFSLKEHMMGISLKHKGLSIPSSKRGLGGIKVKKSFLLPNGEEAVSIDFSYVKLESDGSYTEVSDNSFTHIKKHLKYYHEDGTIYCDKVEYELIKNVIELLKSRATYAVNHLTATANALGAGPVVKMLFNHFKVGLDEWKGLGDPSTFITLINNETDANILGTLNAEIPGYEPKTFGEAIMEHLTKVAYDA